MKTSDSVQPLATMSKIGFNRPIRIAHLATRLIIAGMGNVVAGLVRGIPKEWCQQDIWCLEEADTLGHILMREGHAVIELGRRHRRDFGLIWRIACLIRERQIEVLHCHDELAWFYGVFGGLLGGVRSIIVTMHGRRRNISWRHLWEQRVLARLSTHIVCVSDYLGGQIMIELGVCSGKVVVIRNGIDLRLLRPNPHARSRVRQELGLQDCDFVVGTVGRLDAVKNFDLLFEAIREAKSVVPSLRLILVGEGPYQQHLKEKRTVLGLSDYVVMTGLRHDIPDLLASFDLYVCSSDYEGISLSILEAMAEEKAVVATAVGGNSEILVHEKTGLLVKAKDKATLTEAIVELANNQAKRVVLGQQARKSVERDYNLSLVIEGYGRLYRNLLN